LAAIEAINAPCWEFDERVLDSTPSNQPKRAKRSRRRQSSHAETSRGDTTQRIRPDTVTSKEAKVSVRTVKPEAAAGTTSAAPTDSSNVRRSGRLKKGTDADASAPNPRPSKRQKVKGKP
jgi:hypothetical protein